MLSRRKIELRCAIPGLPQPLIPHETLIDCGRAEALLQRAQDKAQTLLHDARQERERLLEQARAAFWTQANAQLQSWEAERQTMRNALERCAADLVNQALRSLLDEVTPPHRLNALLRQLSAVQSPKVNATLRCHPHSGESIQHWLDERGATLWQLQSDKRLSPLALVLETPEGDLRIDWDTCADSLLLTENP